jgi:D-xylose transport system substrate-binding protein
MDHAHGAARVTPRHITASMILAALAAPGCKGSSEAASVSAGPKVAFLLATLQEERYQKDKRYFEDAARRQGLAPFTLSADNDNSRQLSQVEDALSRGARVLVVQPTDSAAAGGYVSRAHAEGAKVVAYDRSIPGADFYVSHDSHEVGVLQAEQAIKATGGKGNFVLLEGQSGHSVASEITRGYRDVLQPYIDKGDVVIVSEKHHDAWSPEQALNTVQDAISKTSGQIHAILANNSGMARGAVQALSAAGLADKGIFIAGADADAANVNYVCEKKQSVEVLKDIRPLAERAASVAASLAAGTPVESTTKVGGVPVVAVPVVLVTANNARAVAIDSGFHAAAAVAACR